MKAATLRHRPRIKGGYFPVAPVDSAVDIRGEMVSTMIEMGLPCDKHHHESRPRSTSLGLTYGSLVETAGPDADLQICRAPGRACLRQDRDVHAQADQGDNGSGMHTHFSIWNGAKPLFAGNG
jgi:glutamine synthetase